MSFQKVSVFATALLALAVIVMAVVMYVQLSEIRELREDIASLQQAAEAENQGLLEELASLRTEMAELDSSEDLTAIQKSISRLRLQSLGVLGGRRATCQPANAANRPARAISLQYAVTPTRSRMVVGAVPGHRSHHHAERLRLRVALRNRRGPPGVPWGRCPRGR